jgi:HAD superfamily hydrolase (TIGR01509 family)
MYKAILFDMDGVVVDTHQAVTAFWQQVAADYRCSMTSEDLNQYVYGRSASETFDALFSHLTWQQRQAVFQALQAYEQHAVYREVSGAVTLLRNLSTYHIPMALVTSAQRWKTDAVLSQMGISGLFAASVTAQDIGRGKPDPECYLRAAHLLNQPVSSCIVFEDAPAGVQAALAAGALCVGVRPKEIASPLLEAGAKCVIPDFTMVTIHRSLSQEEKAPAELSLCIGTDLRLPLLGRKAER